MRKLLGYRLKSEKHRKAAIEIASINMESPINLERIKCNIDFLDLKKNSMSIYNLQQAGVMHWFEEVYEEEKLEVGKWYKGFTKHRSQFMGILTDKKGIDFGFFDYNWSDNPNGIIANLNNCTEVSKCTTKEVEEALIKEAKKRGFKEGVKFNYPDKLSLGTRVIKSNYFEYTSSINTLCESSSRYNIFQNGKWAEIIEEPKDTFDLPSMTLNVCCNNLNGKTAIIDGVEYELKLK